MAFLTNLRKLAKFGYDATVSTPKRRTPPAIMRSEDNELTPSQRQQIIASVRDVARNSSLAAWAVRKHLDYVTSFSFQAKTGNDALDTKLASLVEGYSAPKSFDIAGRHWRNRFFRIAEARRILDGDCGVLKLASGHVQAIEGDRIRNPYGTPQSPSGQSNLSHGVRVDQYGRAIAYAICNRVGDSGFTLDREVSADNLYLHSNFDRFDQVRGISPLASSYNTLRDVYEGFDYSLVKLKVAAIFGLAVYRENGSPLGAISENETDGDGNASAGKKVDFGKAAFLLDLDRDDRAEFLENKTPSIETQAFFEVAISLALKALDIPYSFYNESFTNYSGSRGAYLQYEQSAEVSRQANRFMLDDWVGWRLGLAIQDGELPGATLNQLTWQWVHRGQPWLDPFKEVQADHFAIGYALDNPEDIAQRHGRDVYENIDKIARVNEYAASKGVTLQLINKVTNILDENATDHTTGQAA